MTLFATPQEYCATLDAIMSGSTAILNQLSGRISALRRLAALLDLAGTSIPLPNPADLIPVGLIDINKYQELAAACPGLLPPYTGQTLETLKATVSDAYVGLLNQTLGHPFDRMSRLQGEINAEISSAADKLSQTIGPAINALPCIQALCGAASAVSTGGAGVLFSPEVVEAAKESFEQNIVLNPTVLTPSQQVNADSAVEVESTLRGLLPQPEETTEEATETVEEEVETTTSTVTSTPDVVTGAAGPQGPQGSSFNVAARIHLTAPQFLFNSVPVAVIFGAVDYDTASLWSADNPTRLTVVNDGVFVVTSQIEFNGTSWFEINGDGVRIDPQDDDANGVVQIALTAGSYIELWVDPNGSQTLTFDPERSPYLSIARVA